MLHEKRVYSFCFKSILFCSDLSLGYTPFTEMEYTLLDIDVYAFIQKEYTPLRVRVRIRIRDRISPITLTPSSKTKLVCDLACDDVGVEWECAELGLRDGWFFCIAPNPNPSIWGYTLLHEEKSILS